MGKSDGDKQERLVERRTDRYARKKKRRQKARRRSAYIIPLIVILALAAVAGGFFVWRAYGSGWLSGDAEPQSEASTTLAGGVDGGSQSAVGQLVASMSLEERVGQLLMVGLQGTETDADVAAAIKDQHIGSFILFARNVKSREQVTALTAALQTQAAEAGQPVKLIIATDQEGGKTRRFEDIAPFYSQPMIGEMGEAAGDTVQHQSSSAVRELKKLGVNTNLAPVADVSGGWGTIMDGRSYGDDAEMVAELAGRAVKAYNNATTISAPKHFPGIGSADEDTEEAPATVEMSREDLEQYDLRPFREVIAAGAPMIMVSHASVPALDPADTPASLSKPIMTDLLRNQMAFGGVIITDDLEMGAITEQMDVGEAAVASLAAGADMVMVAHTPEARAAAYDAIINAVKAGTLDEQQINRSVERILEMKRKYRLER